MIYISLLIGQSWEDGKVGGGCHISLKLTACWRRTVTVDKNLGQTREAVMKSTSDIAEGVGRLVVANKHHSEHFGWRHKKDVEVNERNEHFPDNGLFPNILG